MYGYLYITTLPTDFVILEGSRSGYSYSTAWFDTGRREEGKLVNTFRPIS